MTCVEGSHLSIVASRISWMLFTACRQLCLLTQIQWRVNILWIYRILSSSQSKSKKCHHTTYTMLWWIGCALVWKHRCLSCVSVDWCTDRPVSRRPQTPSQWTPVEWAGRVWNCWDDWMRWMETTNTAVSLRDFLKYQCSKNLCRMSAKEITVVAISDCKTPLDRWLRDTSLGRKEIPESTSRLTAVPTCTAK